MIRTPNGIENTSKLLIFIGVLLFSFSVFAVTGRTTYQAKIVKPDGQPLEASSVNFRFTILDPAASCILYIEDYAAVNMTGTGGLISFALGAGTRSYPVSMTTFASVFDNSTVSFPCQAPGIYNPTSIDARKIVMQFQDTSGWQTLPAMAINAVPYAMYAAKSTNSTQLNGKSDTAFVENSTLAALNCNPATHAITFNGVSFSCLAVGSGGSGITSVTTSGSVLSTAGTASAPVISITAATLSQDGYLTSLDYAEFKAKLSASSTQIINALGYSPVSSSAVTNQISGALASQTLSGDVTGNANSNTVATIGGKTASQVSTSVNDTLAASSANVTGAIVKRDSSGNFIANDVYANSVKVNYTDIYKPSTNFSIRLQAPTSLAANYNLILPNDDGTTGQVLSTDGSGNLTWVSASTGSVTSVSATAPLSSTGGATPTISISQATSSTNGYLSSTDFNTFNSKQNQSAELDAISATAALGILQRTGAATYSGLGLSAPLQITAGNIVFNLTSDMVVSGSALALSTTGVSAGTYTKVVVDTKGRVTSAAQLSSSDVTSALGYTPSNAASAGITTLNGSSSATQIFAAGTTGTFFNILSSNGTHTFNIPLANTGSVTAGLLSNTDYTTFNNKQTATSAAIIATLGYIPANATSATQWTTNGSNIYYNIGNIGVGIVNPSAKLELASGTASVAPVKFTSGTLLSSAQSGTMEYDGFNFYLTDSSNTRRTIATGSSAGTIDNASTINSTGNISMVPVGSVIVSSTTASTNSNTGALVVKGGLGVTGAANFASDMNVSGSAVIDGSLKLSTMTSGSVLFSGANGTVTQDNSSLYWDGANKRLAIGSNSPTQTLSISGTGHFSGNVGIGTTTPTAAKLQVMQAGTGTAIYGSSAAASGWGAEFYNTDSGGALAYAKLAGGPGQSNYSGIFMNGNVGIGTSSPNYLLTVKHPSTHTEMLVDTVAASTVTNIRIHNNGVQKWVFSNRGNLTTPSDPLYLYNSSTPVVTFQQSGNVGIGTTNPTQKLEIVGPVGDSNAPIQMIKAGATDAQLGFGVNTNYAWIQSHNTKPLYINELANDTIINKAGGNVGIGTVAPDSKLDVVQTAAGKNGVRIYKDGAYNSEGNNSVRLLDSTGADTALQIGIDATNDIAYLQAMQPALSWTNRPLVLQGSGGNVGIGTASPSSRLSVYGFASAESGLDVMAKYNCPSGDVTGSCGTTDENTGMNTLQRWGFSTHPTTWNLALKRNHQGWGNVSYDFVTKDAVTETTAVSIKYNGNVGIGTVSPTQKLTVAGTIESTTGGVKFPDGTIQATAAGSGPYKAAEARTTTAQSVANGTWTVITNLVKQYDTGGFWSAATPDRFTIPVGINYVRVTGYMGWASNATGPRYVQVFKNGVTIFHGAAGGPYITTTDASSDGYGRGQVVSPPIPVVAGDYLQIAVWQSSGAAINLLDGGISIEASNGTTSSSAGSGTANYIPLWANSVTLGNSPIAVSAGNVGIGTTALSEKVNIGTDGRMMFTANSSWGASFVVGGNGRGTLTDASIMTTNGNLHLDARNGGYGTYLNWYSASTTGVHIGNGATTYGTITASNYATASDRRLKENIHLISEPLSKVNNLKGVTFNWKNDGQKDIGFIAQEVEKVLPELVKDNHLQNGEEVKTVKYSNVVAVLVEAFKEFYQKWLNDSELKNREIALLKEENADLKKQSEMMRMYLCEKDPAALICK